jgi:hypothetical protein
MRSATFLFLALALSSCALPQFPTAESATRIHRDPAGFTIEIPPDWKVQSFDGGHVSASAPDNSQFVLVSPVLGRGSDCSQLIKNALNGNWPSFQNVSALEVRATSKREAVARFLHFQGRLRAGVLCSATGPNSAMFFAISAPAEQFDAARPALVAALRSFKFQSPTAPGNAPARNTSSALPLQPFREPQESAFTTVVPSGWQHQGGVTRISNSNVTVAYRFLSPGNESVITLGDPRLSGCLVPGPATMTSSPPGQGYQYCPYRDGTQIAELWLTSLLVPDFQLQNLRIIARNNRPDLAEPLTRQMAAIGAANVNVHYGEIVFEATRNGAPISGRVLGVSNFLRSVDPNLLAGSYKPHVNAWFSPASQAGSVGAAASAMVSKFQWNHQWVAANNEWARRDANAVLNFQRYQSELGQKMFQESSDSNQRIAEARGDLLSGRVRLKDHEGNQFEARAGSNYYYVAEQDARTGALNPPVTASDTWLPENGGPIDLRALEIIR